MTDRLADIKAGVAQRHSEGDRLPTEWLRWLIAQVEQLQAALDAQTWCPDCGKVLEIPNPLAAEIERLEERLAEAAETRLTQIGALKSARAEVERLEAAVAEARDHIGYGLAAMSHEAYKTHCVDAMAALRSIESG